MSDHRRMSVVRAAVAAIVAVLLATTPDARAQVHTGVIADPITQQDLDRYVERLDLSAEQRRAAEQMLQTYLAAVEPMRDGALAAFLRAHEHFGSSTTEVPDPEQARAAARDLRRLHATLRTQDERFFDQLSSVLSESQLARLPRLRAARARARHLGGPAQRSYDPALDTDFSEVYLEIADGIDPAVRPETDALVETYERTLDRVARTLHEFALEYQQRMAERLAADRGNAAAAGDETEDADFARRAHLVRAFQTELADRVGEVQDLHRRVYETLAALVDDVTREALRRRFLRAYYPALPVSRGPAEEEIDRVLAMENLPPDFRAAWALERLVYVDAIDRITTKKLDVSDARRRSNASHSLQMILDDDPYVYDDPATFARAMRDLDRRAARIDAATFDRLQVLLDEQWPGRVTLDRPSVDDDAYDLPAGGLHSSASVQDGKFTYGYRGIPVDRLLRQFGAARPSVRPISRRDLARWRRMLDLDADAFLLLDVLHGDYLDRCAAAEETGAIAALRRAREAILAPDDRKRPVIPSEDDVRALFRHERAAIEAMRELDAGFLDDAAIALGDDLSAADRARLDRDRARALYRSVAPPVSYSLFTFGAARERGNPEQETETVDVTTLLAGLELDVASHEGLAALLLAYEDAATGLFRRAFDAALALDEERALLMARTIRYDEEDGLVAEGIEVPEAMDEAGARLVRVLTELLALNRRFRSEIETVLSPDVRARFAAAYKRAAWPWAYRDDTAVHDALEIALAFEDLSPKQRAAITELSLGYRAAYDARSDQLIAAAGDGDALARHRFDRDALNEQTRRALADALGPARSGELPGLSRPE